METKSKRILYERWWWRSTDSSPSSFCRLEIWGDDETGFSVLITERAGNPGPSVTNAHMSLRESVFDLILGDKRRDVTTFYEQYDRDSYRPARDDLSEISKVSVRSGRPHWSHVPDEQWQEIYDDAKRKNPKILVRRSASQSLPRASSKGCPP